MKYFGFFSTLVLISNLVSAQVPCPQQDFRVLHFTRVSTQQSFDHGTRDDSRDMFIRIGNNNNFSVTNTQNTDLFNSLDSLLKFKVIIWSNTSGNNVLTAAQEANFEAYINNGGSYMGMHAASDTYRDRSWPFYNDLVGAIVQSGPNHTSNNFQAEMDTIGSSLIVGDIDDPWDKREEYYYWELNGGNINLLDINEILRVENTGNDSYDAPRPMAWTQTFSNGARSFYTALGHANWNYVANPNGTNANDNLNFQRLMKNGVCWAANNNLGVLPITLEMFEVEPIEDQARIDIQFYSQDVEEIILQRSLDGVHFNNLEYLPTENGFFEHQFFDPKLNDQIYYRLYWRNLDGSEEYSLIKTVYFEFPFWQINTYAESIEINIPKQMLQEKYMVVDAFGRNMTNGEFTERQHVIPTAAWTAGTYFIKTTASGQISLSFSKF